MITMRNLILSDSYFCEKYYSYLEFNLGVFWNSHYCANPRARLHGLLVPKQWDIMLIA